MTDAGEKKQRGKFFDEMFADFPAFPEMPDLAAAFAQVEKRTKVAEETRDAMRSIALSLKALANVVETDHLGKSSVRVIGDFIGGDGDVPSDL